MLAGGTFAPRVGFVLGAMYSVRRLHNLYHFAALAMWNAIATSVQFALGAT